MWVMLSPQGEVKRRLPLPLGEGWGEGLRFSLMLMTLWSISAESAMDYPGTQRTSVMANALKRLYKGEGNLALALF
jgi:hypothetical protein